MLKKYGASEKLVILDEIVNGGISITKTTLAKWRRR